MKNYLKIILSNYLTWLIVLAVLFFLAVSSFNYYTQDSDFVKWLSPDETANYILTKLYGQEGRLSIFEKYNLYVDDVMRPRSFRSDYGEIKPVSFLGIILIFGSIVNLFSYKLIPYLTPFFASIGIIYYYFLVKRLFNKNIAFVSAILLSFFPVYTYYSARSMFHNVLFLVFLIIGFYYSLLSIDNFEPNKQKGNLRSFKEKVLERLKEYYYSFFNKPRCSNFLYLFYSILGGLFTGLAIMVRTSELMWIVPLFVFLWILNYRRIGFLKLLLFVASFLFALLPMFYYNQILYSNPFLGGYSEMNQSIINIKEASTDIVKSTIVGEITKVSNPLEKLKKSIFYFGLQPRQSYLRLKYYFVFMFPWIFWPSFFGGLIFLYRAIENKRKKYFLYIASYLLVSFILIIYYGSWGFQDNPDPNSFTIGNSYTRYWLPVYLGAFPFVAILVLQISQYLSWPFKKKFLNKYIKAQFVKWFFVSLFLILSSFLSIRFVLSGSEEGLIYVAQNQIQAGEEARKILDLTEGNSVIITLYHDKLLFPERKVVVGLFDDKAMVERYSRMVNYIPVYYYNFTLPEKDIKYLNERRLAEFDLSIKKVQKVTKDFTLYRLERRNLTELNKVDK